MKKRRFKTFFFLFLRFFFACPTSVPLADSPTPGASLLLLCPRQTPCAQPPPLLRCSTRPAPRTLTEAHTSRRRQPPRHT